MPEEVLFESENRQSRSDIATYFRSVADALEAGDPITLAVGEQSVELDIPNQPTFEVKAEREGQPDQPGELSIEFEIEWDENGQAGGDLTIE